MASSNPVIVSHRKGIDQAIWRKPTLTPGSSPWSPEGLSRSSRATEGIVRSLVSGNFFEPLNNLLKEDTNTVFELIEGKKGYLEMGMPHLVAKTHLVKIFPILRILLNR